MTTKELLALVGKATPGPWKLCDGPEGFEHRVYMDGLNLTVAEVVRNPDARLIVAAVNALPALCAEVDALQAVAEAARRSLSQTAANQRDGLVPTVYYRAHQDLANALAAIDAAKEPK